MATETEKPSSLSTLSDSCTNDQIDVFHYPLFEMEVPPPPPPPPSSFESPHGVDQFPTGDATNLYSPFRKRHSGKTLTNKTNENTDLDSSFSSRAGSGERQRTIKFNTRVRARDILSHHDMTPLEHRAYWIQEDEYQAITRRNARIVRAIEKSYDNNDKKKKDKKNSSGSSSSRSSSSSKRSDPKDLCPRGLESGLKSEYKTRETAILESLQEVFNEQEKQYYVGVYDDEAIAYAYNSVTSKSAFRAQLRAMLDRKEIEEYTESGEEEDNFPIENTSNHSTKSNSSKPRMLRKISSIRSWVRFGIKSPKATRKA